MFKSFTSNNWLKQDKNGIVCASSVYKNDNGVVSSIKRGKKYIHGKVYDISFEEAMKELENDKRNEYMIHVLENKQNLVKQNLVKEKLEKEKLENKDKLVKENSYESSLYQSSLQDKDKYYCTSPYEKSNASSKERVQSCSRGGKKNSVNRKSYDNLQQCVEVCHEGSKNYKKRKSKKYSKNKSTKRLS